MKLLNFSNLEFKWEEEKEILSCIYYVGFFYELKYLFAYPTSFYFRNYTFSELQKKNYHFNFVTRFKYLKWDIENETS